MVPIDRASFKQYCLRQLGWPDINIELSQEAIEDRIDEALWMYATYHYGGTETMYYKYLVQQQDITNKYITLPANIIGAVRIFDVASYFGQGDIFNVQYQIALNDMWNLTNFNLVPFYMAMQHLAVIREVLVGKQPIRYNRNTNIFYLDTNWTRFKANETYLIVECYAVIDPNVYPTIWSDVWLQRYTTALIKKNWGQVISKYSEMPLTGGVKLDGKRILAEGIQECKDLESELVNTWSQLPNAFLIG